MSNKKISCSQIKKFVLNEFSLESTYQFFFRIGLMFATLALITSSTAVTLLPYEKEAFKDRYAFESKMPVQSWEEFDCEKSVDEPLQADCKLAKYEQKSMQSILSVVDKLYHSSICLSVVFFLLMIISYIFNARKRLKAMNL